MSKTLIVSGHPDIANSTANRVIVEELLADKSLTAIDIMMNYPDYKIDIKAEQELLLSADLIIIQAPFMWYGLPAHVRLWIEKVFTRGFAHGGSVDKLRGKSLLLSFTAGSEIESYTATGRHQYPVEYFLKPLELFIHSCGMNYLPPVFSFGMNAHTPEQKQVTIIKAQQHAEKLKNIISRFSSTEQQIQVLKRMACN